MTNRLVGIDIGSATIRAVEVDSPSTPHARVVRRREIPLPAGAARQGEVVDSQAMAEALKRLWATGGFKTKKVVVGMGGQRIMARELTVPRMSMAQIRASLPYQVQDTLPVPVGDLLLDVYPVADGGGENGRVVRGLLIAALRESVRAQVEAVQLAGLEAVIVDVVPFALVRALDTQLKEDAVVAIVDVGANTTSVVVAQHGVPQFVRVIKAGGQSVTAELAETLGMQSADAEQLKMHVDLRTEAEIPQHETARTILLEFERSLLRSLRATLGYYMSGEEAGPIDRIVLTGGGARLEGFADALAELSGVPVVEGRPFAGVSLARQLRATPRDESDQTYAVALGLAMASAA